MASDSQDSDTPAPGVELDPAQISPGALRGLVEEYVTREGTDYGAGNGEGTQPRDREWSLEEKVVQVLGQIDRGEAKIVFDLETETAGIVTAPELALHVLAARQRASQHDEPAD